MTVVIDVPFDRLEPGPRSSRLHVVDIDVSTSRGEAPFHIADSWAEQVQFGLPTESPSLPRVRSREFRAWNAWAIATRTVDVFESTLGRRIPLGI